MNISPAEVERIARLAELAVAPEELAPLAAQLDRIVGFVAQLGAFAAGAETAPELASPAPLREDVIVPPDPAVDPSRLAPEFAEGFFVVPRLGAAEGE